MRPPVTQAGSGGLVHIGFTLVIAVLLALAIYYGPEPSLYLAQ